MVPTTISSGTARCWRRCHSRVCPPGGTKRRAPARSCSNRDQCTSTDLLPLAVIVCVQANGPRKHFTANDIQASARRAAQLTAFLTSAPILASSAAVNFVKAKAFGHMFPSSRFARSLKPNVAYLVLNFCALWKKHTTLPSLAYAGIPYQVFGERVGALALTIAWSRSAIA